MSNIKKLMMSAAGDGAVLPEAVEFSTNSDYLYRNSDLSGNTNSKTFTFSGFVYAVPDINQTAPYFYLFSSTIGTAVRFQVFSVDRYLRIYGYNSSGTLIMRLQTDYYELAGFTWNHILISCDMADSSKRHCYFNERQIEDADFLVYTNAEIDFTTTTHAINDYNPGYGISYPGRAAHLFLDYTYRDLTVESNRRLFVTEDLKPADGQASLSPILYLPMTSADTAGTNLGSGGDFSTNGSPETASRAPNQGNCTASVFNGLSDYLYRSGALAASNSRQATISVNFKRIGVGTMFLFDRGSTSIGSHSAFSIRIYSNGQARLYFSNATTSGGGYAYADLPAGTFAVGANYQLSYSMDLDDTSKRHVYINGVAQPDSVWIDYTVTTINWSYTGATSYIGKEAASSSGYYNYSIGELYADNVYTDMSAGNPFWDEDAERPKPLRQVIDELSSTPLLAMPISGDNPGLNLGSAGDFTLSGGGIYGARSLSEYWSRSIKGDGSTGYLLNSSISNVPSSNKTMTMVWAFQYREEGYQFEITDGGSQIMYLAPFAASNKAMAYINAGPVYVYNNSNMSFNDTWYVCLLSFDASDTSKRHFYVNGVENAVWDTYTDATIPWANMDKIAIAARTNGTNEVSDELSFIYFSNTYIDFSQESNRNLFVDKLGYPKDLTSSIESGDIATPLVYMKFEDSSNLGVNSGNGGNFTVNGTVNADGDVDIHL